jgi:hypothetical protein
MSTSINSNTTLTNSFSPKHNGLLRPVYNNIYYNQDPNFTTITNEESTDMLRDSLNNTTFTNHNDDHNPNNNNNNYNLNLNVNNNSNSNDINPRKHSPGLFVYLNIFFVNCFKHSFLFKVPISPPTNIEYTTDNSIEILQNHLRQKHHQQINQNKNSEDKLKNDFKMNNSLDKWFKEFKAHVVVS